MERGTHPLLDRFRQIEAVVQNGLLEIKYLAVALMGSGDGVDEEQEDRFIADLTRCIGHIEMSLIEDAAGIDRYDYSTTSGDGYSFSKYYSGPTSKSDHRDQLQRTHDRATRILNKHLSG